MTPNPKRGKLFHKPYEDWCRKQRCAFTDSPIVVFSHRRKLHGGGTALKPPSFHGLPVNPNYHNEGHSPGLHGKTEDGEEDIDLCLDHVARYFKERASFAEKRDILDMLNQYAITWGI